MESVNITSMVQYGSKEYPYGIEVPETECLADIDTSLTDSVESLEQLYLEQLEFTTKINNSRQKGNHKTNENDQIPTYRKIMSKDKEERKLPASYYRFDKTTMTTVARLIGARSIPQYHDVIGRGKNSVVISTGTSNVKQGYYAAYFSGRSTLSFVNAIKIYKLSDNENLNRARYEQVEKEFKIIARLTNGRSVDWVPYGIHYHNNIIVTGLIGSHKEPAVPLTSIFPERCQVVYDRIIQQMNYIYYCGVVHGGLSRENILIWRNTPHYVGWSHAVYVWRNEPTAHKKLIKDCNFINKFFKKKDVQVLSIKDLFLYVTEMKKISSEVLDEIYKYNKEPKPKLRGNPNRERVPVPTPDRNSRFKHIS